MQHRCSLCHGDALPREQTKWKAPAYLDRLLDFMLEASKEDLPLAWLESVDGGGDGARQVGHAEEDELLVHKVVVVDHVHALVQERARLPKEDKSDKSKPHNGFVHRVSFVLRPALFTKSPSFFTPALFTKSLFRISIRRGVLNQGLGI